MPIFVSRFSAQPIAAPGLQRARTESQSGSRRSTRDGRTEQTGRSERGRGTQRGERAQDQLPIPTQTAESIREELQSRERPGGDSTGETQDQASQETERRSFPVQATLPGVSTVSSRARTSATVPQVGRLDREAKNPQLSRFEGLRNARPPSTGNARSAEVRQAFRDIPSEAQGFTGLQAQRLSTQVDASIRLLRSNQGRSAEAAGRSPAEPTPQEATASRPSVTLESDATSAAAQPPQDRPTVEQISRANTTPEILKNLQQDFSENGFASMLRFNRSRI
jgi:hypothetical protein